MKQPAAAERRIVEELRALPVVRGGRDDQEIARICGVSRMYIWSIRQRALAKIRVALERELSHGGRRARRAA